MAAVAERKQKIESWGLHCDSDQHPCVCHMGKFGPVFGELLTRCLAQTHSCVCDIMVIPDDQLTVKLNSAKLTNGSEVCRSQNHACVCKTMSSQACKSTGRHDCSCGQSTATCRLNEFFDLKIPTHLLHARLHDCQCVFPNTGDKNSCRRHPSGPSAMRPPVQWWSHP